MEARLGVTAGTRADAPLNSGPENAAPADSPEDALAPAVTAVAAGENGANVWTDEAAEAVFLAGARERGEPAAVPRTAAETAAEQTDATNLPNLDELVQRIPAEVRETLDDLFRAKFTTVRRVPKKAFNR